MAYFLKKAVGEIKFLKLKTIGSLFKMLYLQDVIYYGQFNINLAISCSILLKILLDWFFKYLFFAKIFANSRLLISNFI